MTRLNLLPHRAEKRRRRKIQFFALLGVSAALGGVVIGLFYGFMSAQIFLQDKRNDYLKKEISILEKQIAELERLQKEINALLQRKAVVEDLQRSRSDVVHLMDQMLRILPPGVYLKNLKQAGNKITIVGNAQSDARVSTLMRSIDASPWLEGTGLVDVHAVTTGKERTNEFTLTFTLKKGADIAAAASAARAAAAASSPVAASSPAAASAPANAAPPQAGAGKKG